MHEDCLIILGIGARVVATALFAFVLLLDGLALVVIDTQPYPRLWRVEAIRTKSTNTERALLSDSFNLSNSVEGSNLLRIGRPANT